MYVPKITAQIFATTLVAAILCLSSSARDFSEAERKHWSFQPIKRTQVPASTQATTEIDAFILKRLGDKKISLNPKAGKATLLRRASLDLTGLPPTPEELQAFQEDTSPQAFEKVVDRLLQSPHYGEKWARHWLDLARYAESEGFKADETRPNAWRYRDYVIKSFNEDKPYDRFLKEQIAGDEFWPEDPDALVATGFSRHYPDESNARNLMQRRQEILNDITDTVGAVFTGLTFGCARCHDHKYDPILQADYYRLQAFFANAAANDNIPLLSRNELANYKARLAVWEEATRELRDQIKEIAAPHRKFLIDDYVEKYPAEIREALLKPAPQRTAFECQMVAKAELYINPASHQYIGTSKAVANRLKGKQKEQWENLHAELKRFEHLHPGELPTAAGVVDISNEAPTTYVLARGTYDTAKDQVKPGFLALLNKSEVHPMTFPDRPTTGRRAALASLLTDTENPLTARVMANRIWQGHFGRGLVDTSSDFGMKGARPTHPELLDWLASEFVDKGWSIKAMHKLIMLSAVYQQSSAYNEAGGEIDPANNLWWRFPRQRLQGETIRDAALAVSGLLNPAMGGPSVFPELPSGIKPSYDGWKTSSRIEERNRRSIYIFVRRNLRYPMFETFDMPDTHESCAKRQNTTSPLQALSMLNGKVSLEWAQSFADRVLKVGGNPETQIAAAYELAYSRPATRIEIAAGLEFIDSQMKLVEKRIIANEEIALPASSNQENAPHAAALVDFCHTLLNSNEFVYLN